ncbi:hypothetical protein [Actinomadura algeriensis]|uniref:Uncharacterized protein n=1 Tax=Actinomadura algeriensis TaxID=1679523 RepID=A0ABR9JJX4_9ACTN|nr:hypothetical protein [Actinomadura algeriensis]MBE1530686.1 hypothetical protein [Actinomadura algeriensis]
MLRLRTRFGRPVAVYHLEPPAGALQSIGWKCVRLYEREEFEIPTPVLWVHAGDVGVLVSALAAPRGSWAYYQAQRGRDGLLFPCGDVKGAAGMVDELIERRMFPDAP